MKNYILEKVMEKVRKNFDYKECILNTFDSDSIKDMILDLNPERLYDLAMEYADSDFIYNDDIIDKVKYCDTDDIENYIKDGCSFYQAIILAYIESDEFADDLENYKIDVVNNMYESLYDELDESDVLKYFDVDDETMLEYLGINYSKLKKFDNNMDFDGLSEFIECNPDFKYDDLLEYVYSMFPLIKELKNDEFDINLNFDDLEFLNDFINLYFE